VRACIATSVLMRLARWIPDRAERYQSVAKATLKALIADFPHGWWRRVAWKLGRMRNIEARPSPVLAGFPQEDIMPYGNYWIADASTAPCRMTGRAVLNGSN